MVNHCVINEMQSGVIVKREGLIRNRRELCNFQLLEIPMLSTVYPDHAQRQVYAQRAHRLRSAALAGLVREIARLVSAAAR